MKIIILIFLNVILCMNLYSQEFKNKEIVRLAFLNQFQLLKDFSDARDSLAKWLEGIGKKRDVEISVKFYQDMNQLYTDYKDSKVDMIVVSSEFFFKNIDDINNRSKNFWSLAYEPNREYRYCLIGGKNHKFNDIQNLKNSSFVVKAYERTGGDWLDYLSLATTNGYFKKLPSNIKYEEKETTVLLNVFFKKYDYGLIRKNTWNTMLELNPAIKKNVNLIECSKTNFIPFVGFFTKKMDDEFVKIFFETAGKLTTYEDSEEIFTLLSFDHIFKLEKEKIDSLKKFYDKLETLKKKNN